MTLELENVSFAVGRKTLIEGVTLSVLPGRLTVILGANGAGKSTMLSVLAGDLAPSSGDAHLDGAPLSSLRLQGS